MARHAKSFNAILNEEINIAYDMIKSVDRALLNDKYFDVKQFIREKYSRYYNLKKVLEAFSLALNKDRTSKDIADFAEKVADKRFKKNQGRCQRRKSSKRNTADIVEDVTEKTAYMEETSGHEVKQTFVVNSSKLEKIRIICGELRTSQKELIDLSFDGIIRKYEKEYGTIVINKKMIVADLFDRD